MRYAFERFGLRRLDIEPVPRLVGVGGLPPAAALFALLELDRGPYCPGTLEPLRALITDALLDDCSFSGVDCL